MRITDIYTQHPVQAGFTGHLVVAQYNTLINQESDKPTQPLPETDGWDKDAKAHKKVRWIHRLFIIFAVLTCSIMFWFATRYITNERKRVTDYYGTGSFYHGMDKTDHYITAPITRAYIYPSSILINSRNLTLMN